MDANFLGQMTGHRCFPSPGLTPASGRKKDLTPVFRARFDTGFGQKKMI
jgi:hypothetical protein